MDGNGQCGHHELFPVYFDDTVLPGFAVGEHVADHQRLVMSAEVWAAFAELADLQQFSCLGIAEYRRPLFVHAQHTFPEQLEHGHQLVQTLAFHALGVGDGLRLGDGQADAVQIRLDAHEGNAVFLGHCGAHATADKNVHAFRDGGAESIRQAVQGIEADFHDADAEQTFHEGGVEVVVLIYSQSDPRGDLLRLRQGFDDIHVGFLDHDDRPPEFVQDRGSEGAVIQDDLIALVQEPLGREERALI
jgi:hypothetical protein